MTDNWKKNNNKYMHTSRAVHLMCPFMARCRFFKKRILPQQCGQFDFGNAGPRVSIVFVRFDYKRYWRLCLARWALGFFIYALIPLRIVDICERYTCASLISINSVCKKMHLIVSKFNKHMSGGSVVVMLPTPSYFIYA